MVVSLPALAYNITIWNTERQMMWQSRGRSFCILVASSISLTLTGTPAFSGAADCEAECAKENSPYCLNIPTLAAGPDIPWALRNLFPFTLPRISGGTIKPAELLFFFGMKESGDPCKRGTTLFSTGSLKNTGESACRITVSGRAILEKSDPIDLGFDVPVDLVSQVKNAGSNILFEFDPAQPKTTPVFWIADDALNGDWGGLLKRVIYSSTSVVVATENGCIRYKY
jgi:hypothetical protein